MGGHEDGIGLYTPARLAETWPLSRPWLGIVQPNGAQNGDRAADLARCSAAETLAYMLFGMAALKIRLLDRRLVRPRLQKA